MLMHSIIITEGLCRSDEHVTMFRHSTPATVLTYQTNESSSAALLLYQQYIYPLSDVWKKVQSRSRTFGDTSSGKKSSREVAFATVFSDYGRLFAQKQKQS